MKILYRGEIPKKPKQFTCKYCGTVFEAEASEYKAADQIAWIHDGISAYCKCPICCKVAYT